MYFRSFSLWKTALHKCLNGNVSWHPSTVNVLNGGKSLWNVHDRTFMTFFYQDEPNWVGRPLSYWYVNSYKSLFNIVCRSQVFSSLYFYLQALYQMQLSKKLKAFSGFFSPFSKSSSNFEHFEKKDEIHSQCIYEIIDCQRYG